MKLLLQHRASTGFLRTLRSLAPPTLEVVVSGAWDAAFHRRLSDTTVLLHAHEPVTKEIIEAAQQLRLIQNIGVGVNTIDLAAAKALGIAVANMPRTNSHAVAEFTLTLMLAALRRISLLDRATREGRGWSLPPDCFDHVGEIGGKRVGSLVSEPYLAGLHQLSPRLAHR